ncbi:putative ribonuclease H-like domain-containing protein [Tanacetum coccineum]|uniref:Ribonuclease H-like domain-containing protein n=1 Tax=Tanacetum coccineum TaxID=301880 RepID=A0ABQ5J599_9ASTR
MVKVIRYDNRTEFKNKKMNQFCERKGIKREFSVARTPQQNRLAKRKNRTLIEDARTMLADSKLPTTFWAEAVNTACYVQNRVLITKPHNKIPYELFLGRKPALGFMRPFECPITILNTIDHLGKFDGKADKGFFVGYSINSKAFRVFNSRTRIVEENLHVQFSENTPNIVGSGPNWLFDIDALTKSMSYKLVIVGNQSNSNARTKACDDSGKARMETVPGKYYILLPLWPADPSFSQNSMSSPDAGFKPSGDNEKNVTKEPGKEGGDSSNDQEKEDDNVNSTNNLNTASDENNTNNVNAVSSTVNAAGIKVNVVGAKTSIELDDPNMPELEDIVYSDDAKDVGAKADMNNLNTFMPVSSIPTTRIHKDHLVEQITGDLNSAPQTRKMTKNLKEHGLFSFVQQRTNHKDFQNSLFASILSQKEPKKVIHALKDPSWIDAMQEELLQFKLQEVWTLVDLTNEKGPYALNGFTGTRRIKEALIEAIRLFLAYASFKDFVVYQMDVKSAFLYGKIEEEVYVCQPPGFEDPYFPDRVYKVENALYGLHQAPRVWYETLSTYLLDNRFQRGKIDKTLFIRRDKGLQVKQKEDGIFISQDKYVTEILKKFGFTDVKTISTPMETQKHLLKDDDVYACARYQVNLKVSHLHAVKRIFRHLKGQPKLGLWYLKDSPFDLVAYTNSDYAGASLDRKSTTGGFQFLGCRLISWQCKKQTVVANSTTEAEYIVASSYCGQATVKVKTVNGEQQLQALVDGKKIIITEATVRRELLLEDADGVDCLPNATIFEQLTLIGVKVQQCQLIPITHPSLLNLHHLNPKGNKNQGGLRRRTLRVGRSARVVSSEEVSLGDQEDASKQGKKINDINKDEKITLVNETQGRYGDKDMFGVNDLDGDKVVVESEVTNKASEKRNIVEEAVVVTDVVTIPVIVATIANVELTLAQTLAELKSERPKTRGVVMQEPSESTPTISLQLPSQVKGQGSKDKGKAKMKEPEKPLKKKDQIKVNEEEALRLQAKFDEEDRLAKEKAQQAQEQQELTIEEKSTLFVQLLEKRKKHFDAKRA